MTTGLAEALAREVGLVKEFIASLTAEQEALKQGTVDALAAINSRKAELAEQLNGAERERNAWLTGAGLSGDRQGMETWLGRNRQDRAAAQHWAQLMALAGEARQLNLLNGQLIAMRLQATNQCLDALTQRAQPSASLYGADGQTTRLTGSRIIDAA